MTARTPAQNAAMDQAMAAAQEAVTPLKGKIVDTRDALLTVVIDADGQAHLTGTTDDWQWVADSLRLLAANAQAKADAGEGR